MTSFFPAVFDSLTALCTAEPVIYCLSIMGLSVVLCALRRLAD